MLRSAALVSLVSVIALACGEATPIEADASTSGSGAASAASAATNGAGGGSSSGDAGGTSHGGAGPGSGAGSTGTGGGAGGEPSSPCDTIAPSTAAEEHRVTIQTCLNDVGRAILEPGLHEVSNGITIPASGRLEGAAGSKPTLRLAAGGTSNYFVKLTGDSPESAKARLASLELDAHDNIGFLANSSIVHFTGNNAEINGVDIHNEGGIATGRHAASVYLICSSCSGNVVKNSTIHDAFYGIIFGPGNTSAFVNVAENNEIYDIHCDPITFVSYGEAIGNTIHDNGWDCENGPIPGGGIYSLTNDNGARIVGNTIHDTCGHGLDIDRVANLVIEDNHVYDPGNTWNGTRPWCVAAAGAFLLDVRDSVVKNNTIENNGRPWNAFDVDPNQVFSATGAAELSDLPDPDSPIAFVLARRPAPNPYTTTHNAIEGNTFRSSCGTAGCFGVGYFASRSTGYDGAGAWSAATTSYYRGNTSFGSDVGSKRCGGNWYAADTTCNAGSPAPCNDDDFQHNAPAGDWARNDGCSFY